MRMTKIALGLALVGLMAGCGKESEDPLAASPGLQRAEQAIAEKPKDGNSYYMRGYLAALVGDEATTRQMFGRGISLAPEDPMMRRGYGWSLFLLGDYEGALGQWEARARLSKDDAYDIYYTQALAHWKLGHKAEAIALFQKAVERDPEFGEKRTLLERTSGWHPVEQATLLEIYSSWNYFY